MFRYDSIAAIIEAAEQANETISAMILKDQAKAEDKTEEELYEQMDQSLDVMLQAVQEGIEEDLRSASGLSGGSAYRMNAYVDSGSSICGEMFGKAMVKALAVSELNACMGKIVAAPTAGSCGILPAVLITMMEQRHISRKDTVMALFTAAGFGMVIANQASISGAEGGCQAECGSASAMAAAALVEMAGGTPSMAGHACAIAIKNVLGLVCDPVAGLVEVPCVKRNAMGTANAFTGAELALAGITSHIPVDEVILAMKRIGDAMPSSLRETAEGGLAETPTGRALKKQIFG